MPSVSEKQRRFFGAELGRKRAGKTTRTGMSSAKLEDFASKREVTPAPDRPAMAPAQTLPASSRSKAAKSLIRR